MMARSSSPDIPVATHDGMQLLLDSPRVLLGDGAHPWTVLVIRHAGSDHDTLSGSDCPTACKVSEHCHRAAESGLMRDIRQKFLPHRPTAHATRKRYEGARPVPREKLHNLGVCCGLSAAENGLQNDGGGSVRL